MKKKAYSPVIYCQTETSVLDNITILPCLG